MNGIELSRRFFEEYGRAMLEDKFPEYLDRIAAGLVGQGSERYGYDDEYSRDHDFCAGFCIYMDGETEEKIGFDVMREYRKLPKEFMGVSTREHTKSGSSRYGVVTFDSLFVPLVGKNYRNLSANDYLLIPQSYLADATNGGIFYDKSGIFTGIYNGIKYGMPEDVRLKKMSANLAGMAQSGQYNYARTLLHGEEGAAVMALCEFVKFACGFIYLANKRYSPYYKWMLRGMSGLESFGNLAPSFEFLLTGGNEPETRAVKSEIIEDICANIIVWLKKNGYSSSDSDFLEDHARLLLSRVSDIDLRNMHILAGADV